MKPRHTDVNMIPLMTEAAIAATAAELLILAAAVSSPATWSSLGPGSPCIQSKVAIVKTRLGLVDIFIMTDYKVDRGLLSVVLSLTHDFSK